MSRRQKPRSNHKPRGAALAEDRLKQRMRHIANDRLARDLPGWERNNRMNVVWDFSADHCSTCGQNLCDLLLHPGPDWPMTVCLNCDYSEPAAGASRYGRRQGQAVH